MGRRRVKKAVVCVAQLVAALMACFSSFRMCMASLIHLVKCSGSLSITVTLKTVLVHPKDKQEKEDLTECVYKVPCANCDKTYIGEIGRKFGVRLQEHTTEVESKTGCTFTRSLRASSLTEHNKSALTDHATQENHVINWSQATVIDREPEHFTRWIKGAIHIRNEGQQAMNRDECSYQLSHAYDCFLVTLRHNMLRCLTLSLPSPSNTVLTDSHLW